MVLTPGSVGQQGELLPKRVSFLPKFVYFVHEENNDIFKFHLASADTTKSLNNLLDVLFLVADQFQQFRVALLDHLTVNLAKLIELAEPEGVLERVGGVWSQSGGLPVGVVLGLAPNHA